MVFQCIEEKLGWMVAICRGKYCEAQPAGTGEKTRLADVSGSFGSVNAITSRSPDIWPVFISKSAGYERTVWYLSFVYVFTSCAPNACVGDKKMATMDPRKGKAADGIDSLGSSPVIGLLLFKWNPFVIKPPAETHKSWKRSFMLRALIWCKRRKIWTV